MNDKKPNECPSSRGRRHQHCRLQFSLRTLLIVVTIACVLFSWLGIVVREKITRDAAIGAIESYGGKVHYSNSHNDAGPFRADVDLSSARMLTDSGLVELAPYLQSLNDIGELHYLSLPPSIGDKGIETLGGLTYLLDLSLYKTDITDAGLAYLAKMNHLKALNLRHTQITDAGLPHLYEHKALVILCLRDTRITANGLRKLKEALPSTMIAPQISPDGKIWEGPPL